MPAERPLEGKVAIVTGGSGALGASIVRAFARDGAKVAWNYAKNEGRASALAAELAKKDFPHLMRKVNGTDWDGMHTFVADVEKTLGPVDILVNNAGVTQVMPLALMEVEDWDMMMNANLKSL